MGFNTKFARGLILSILLTARAWGTPLNPQLHHRQDVNDEEDDTYDEEENTLPPELTKPGGLDSLDSDEIENAAIKLVLSQRLGVSNFSNNAIADRATQYIISYLAGQAPELPPLRPKTQPTPTPSPSSAVTVKFDSNTTEVVPQGVKSIEDAIAAALFEPDQESNKVNSSTSEVATSTEIPQTTSLSAPALSEVPPEEDVHIPLLPATTRRTRVRSTTPRRSKPKPNDSDDDEDDEPIERLTNRLVNRVSSGWGGIKLAICTIEAVFDIECTL